MVTMNQSEPESNSIENITTQESAEIANECSKLLMEIRDSQPATTTIIATTTTTENLNKSQSSSNIENDINDKELSLDITTTSKSDLSTSNALQSSANNNNHALTNQDSTPQLKILAPAMTRDMTLPSTGKKVPMVMVPVPETGHLIAIPLATINQLKDSEKTMDCVTQDEQQARDLLNWNDGIGTLDGCDLRFKINELGDLELIDSDDECGNQKKYNDKQSNNRQSQREPSKQAARQQAVNNKKQNTENAISASSNEINASDDNKFHPKRAKLEHESTTPMRQISPGSSLLRDGPDVRRPKSTSSTSSNVNSSSKNNQQANSSISLLKKMDTLCHNTIVSDKIIPKQRLDEMKANVDRWTAEDVRSFVDSIPGCTGYGQSFEQQQICGKSLMYLDQRDLLDIINVKLGPAVKIYHAISLLKS